MQKILLMYISQHSGHHCASLAIEQALNILRPGIKTLNINAFNYTNPILEKLINKTYMGVIRTKPEVWDYLYDNPKVIKSTQRLRELIHRYNSRLLKQLLDDFKPDAVAATQAFPCGMVADFKKSYNFALPLFGILTDYAPHSYWIYDNIDGYVVPSEETGRRLIENGIKKERVNAFGIPIDPKFTQRLDRDSLMKKMGLDPGTHTVLIMGGGQGLGPIKHVVSALENLNNVSLQIMVVTGTNNSLYKYFKRTEKRRKKKLIFLPYSNNIDELMEASSLLISKPGGATTAEALAKNLPMLIVHPLPGQESMNTEHLLKMDVAVRADDYREAVVLVEELLSHPAKLSQMRERAKKYAKPDSAMKTAELLLGSIKQ